MPGLPESQVARLRPLSPAALAKVEVIAHYLCGEAVGVQVAIGGLERELRKRDR